MCRASTFMRTRYDFPLNSLWPKDLKSMCIVEGYLDSMDRALDFMTVISDPPLIWWRSMVMRGMDLICTVGMIHKVICTSDRVDWVRRSSPLPWASGLPVAIQCTWNLDPSVHWNATGEINVGGQCASSGLPVAYQCVPIMQINTGSPLGHHWVLASASVVPVASQCTCGSSGLPMCSVQWYPSVLTESGLEVIRSGYFPACDPLCIQLVWWELFELNWFHLTCNSKYTKTIMVLISKACTE